MVIGEVTASYKMNEPNSHFYVQGHIAYSIKAPHRSAYTLQTIKLCEETRVWFKELS